MKLLAKCKALLFTACLAALITGCAAGSATAAYSVKSLTADGLSAEAEQRIVNRVKREMREESAVQHQYAVPCYQ